MEAEPLAHQPHLVVALQRWRRAQEQEPHRKAVEEVPRRVLAHLLLSRAALAQPLGHLTAGHCPPLQEAVAMKRAPQPERRRVLLLAPVLAPVRELVREQQREQQRAQQELRPEPRRQQVQLVPERPQLWARASLQPQVQ